MNPMAAAWGPSPTPNTAGADFQSPVNATLCRVLAAEQDAHHKTQLTLENAMKRIQSLEEELAKTNKDNKSLVASVHMLGNIIKYNESRLKKKGYPSPSPSEMASDDGTTATQGLRAASTQSQPNVDPALSASTAKQHTHYQASEDGSALDLTSDKAQNVPPNSPALTIRKGAKVDNLRPYDFDVFQSHTGNSADPLSPATRSLRKHFLTEISPDKNSEDPVAARSKRSTTRELIQISPESTEDLTSMIKALEISEEPKPRSMLDTKASHYGISNLQTSASPQLELPAGFLEKYQNPKKYGQSQPAADGSEADVDGSESEADSFEAGKVAPRASPDPEPETTVSVLEMAERFGHNAELTLSWPICLDLKWRLTRENPLYSDEKARTDAMALSMNFAPRFPKNTSIFWDHPVRYLDYSKPNLFRTVMIDHIPRLASISDVLEQIRGGELEKIQLVQSIGCKDGSQTARVVFNYELGAITTANFARYHGMRILGRRVRVWQVMTQTYPKNAQLDYDVFEQCMTRLLLIDNVNAEVKARLPEKLANYNVVEISNSPKDGMPMVEFTSVAQASAACREFMRDPDFQGARFDFDEDYCGEPYPLYK